MMEVLSDDINSEGFYEEIGTKKVDAITEMKGTEDNLTTIVTSIEDYYDLNGNFTESIIKKEVLKTDYINGLSEVEVYEKKANKPQTFKNKQSVKSVKEAEEFVLNTSDKEEIKTLFNNKFKELSTFSVNKKSGKWYTKDELRKLKDSLMSAKFRYEQSDLLPKYNGNTTLIPDGSNTSTNETNSGISIQSGAYSCGTVQCAGAFDNYYNYNMTTGKFTIQTLSSSAHKYIRTTGSTIGNSTNATSLNKFMGYIDQYESYIIDKMQANSWEVVFDFALFVAALTEFIKGAGTGPAGWVGAMAMSVSIVSLLADFTDIIYATTARANYSLQAEKLLVNAQNQMNYKNWKDYTATLVSGY